jgi:hypothetical protein
MTLDLMDDVEVLAKMREKCKMRDVGSNPTVMNIPYFEVAKWQS